MTEKIAAAKFGVNDTVRFIGTDTIFTVRLHHYVDEWYLYQVQRSDDVATIEWVPEIYLEHAKQPDPRVIETSSSLTLHSSKFLRREGPLECNRDV
jgi:hypothetical protein